MREGWKIVKLDEVISFERGLTYAKGDEVARSSVGVLRSNNVDLTTQSLNLDEIKYLREDFEVPDKKKVKKSSLLMCMSNGSKDHLGKVALIDRELDYAFGGFMGLLTPDEDKVFPKYLYYALASKSFKDYIHNLADGANINNLKYKDLASFDILLPTIPEQQRIVDILDQEFAKIDALKANAEKSLQAAKDLFQATLKKELVLKEGWTYMRLNDLYNFIDYRGSTPTKLTEGIPLITAKNIKMGFLDYTIKDFISQEEYNHRQSRGVSQRGDILFTTEAPLGNVAIADKDVFSAGQRVITFQQYPHTTIELNNWFYLYYFLSPTFQDTLKEQATGATAQGIKASRLKEIKVPFVDSSVQNSITRRLDDLNDKCQSLQRNYQKTLALCDDLKQALLRMAFNGEL